MSGHNPPHGRLGQPNSTWNPLQVPSYIPRQPQLAHMSSERSMARSPLTWHTPPNHQDQLYNFMSAANHKNNLEINPILPTFGRNSGMPLGSVDLSLSSAARSTPSPKGAGNNLQQQPPGLPGPPPLGPLSQQQQQQGPQLPSNIPPGMGGGGGPPPPMPDQNDHFHHKMVPGQQQSQPHGQHQQHHHMNANHNRSGPSSQIGGVIQSTAALKDRSGGHGPLGPGGPHGSGIGNNGGSGGAAPSCSFLGPGPGGLPPQAAAAAGGNGYYNMMSTNSNVPPMPPANVSTASINNRPPPSSSAVVGGLHNMPPMGPIGGGGNDFGGLHIKDAKQLNSEVGKNGRDNIPGGVETSDLVKDILLHAMHSNPVSMSPKRNSSLQTPVPPSQSPTRSRSPPATSSGMDGSAHQPAASVAKAFPLISANVPSTPPEVTPDAAASTKTDSPPLLRAPSTSPAAPSAAVPVPSPSQSVTSNDDSADSNSSKSRRRRKPDRTSKMSSADELERMHDFLSGENSADKCGGVDRIDGIDPMRPNIAVRNDIATLALEGISSLSQGLASDSSHSPHITDLSDSTRINLQQQQQPTTTTTALNESNNRHPESRESPRIKSPAAAVSSVISSVLSAAAAMAESRKDSESTSDDCETIDKIAAMISSTEGDAGAQVPVAATAANENCNGPSAGSVATEATANAPGGEGSSSSGSSKSESQHKPDADKSYEEIENKLEEMFAGIEESTPPAKSSPTGAKKSSPAAKQQAASEPATDILIELAGKPESEPAPGSSNSPPVEAEPGPSGTQKKVLTPAAKRASAGKATGTPPNKRKKVLKKKSAHSKGTSFAAAEERMANFSAGKAGAGKKPITKGGKKGAASAAGSNGGKNAKVKSNEAGAATADLNGKYKGPFVQVKSDGSHMVINAPINEDDSDKPQNKTKKFTNSMNNSEKSKIRGLHVSTLSTKYDADTTDASWMCVFCKTGPHKMRLGDLFGPYIISTKSSEFAESKTDQDYFSEKRTRDSLASKLMPPKVEPGQGAAGGSGAKSKKRKSIEPTASTSTVVTATPPAPSTDKVPFPPADMFYGMVKAGEDSYEVWMHEDCLVWAPGVHIIGTRIVGLEAAIWNCCRHPCRICGHAGAVVSCLRRGCNAEAHVVCARKHDWELSDEFKAHCKDHSEGDDS